MLRNTLNFSKKGSRIEQAKTALNNQLLILKQFKYKTIMDELKKLIGELTANDSALVQTYKSEIVEAEADLIFHQKKIKYFEALIKQRKEFINQIESKLKRIETLQNKLSDKLLQ